MTLPEFFSAFPKVLGHRQKNRRFRAFTQIFMNFPLQYFLKFLNIFLFKNFNFKSSFKIMLTFPKLFLAFLRYLGHRQKNQR